MSFKVNADTQEKLDIMMTVLPDASFINYGTLLNVSKKKACITNGFYLLYLEDDGLPEEPYTVDKRYKDSSVKFPSWQVLGSIKSLDSDEYEALGTVSLMESLLRAPYKLTKNLWLELNVKIHDDCLKNDIEPEYIWPTLFYSENRSFDLNEGLVIDPNVYAPVLKVLLSAGYKPQHLCLSSKSGWRDEPVKISFTGGFTLILLPMKKGV